MEKKRRKLSSRSTSHFPSLLASSSQNDSPESHSLDTQLTSDTPKNVLGALRKYKEQGSSKQNVDAIISEQSMNFRAIIGLLQRCCFKQELSPKSPWTVVLKEAASVIANFCAFSINACMEVKETNHRIVHIAARILESGEKTTSECKMTILRLLGNLCAHKESAIRVATASQLLDRIAITVNHEDSNVGRAALRCLRHLVLLSPSFAKAVISSNGCFYLGLVLAKESDCVANENDDTLLVPQVFVTLHKLVQLSVKDVGRQLHNSDCAKVLLSMFLSGHCPLERSRLIVDLCSGSFEMRESFGKEGAIERIVEMSEVSSDIIRFLCCYSMDAWGRAALREKGALDLLINRLGGNSAMDDRETITSSFRHFVHDTVGIAYLCMSTAYMSTVIQHITEYLEKHHYECKAEEEDEEDTEADIKNFQSLSSEKMGCDLITSAEKREMLARDVNEMWSRRSSPPVFNDSLSRSFASAGSSSPKTWSPSMSPFNFSNISSLSPSSSIQDLQSVSFIDSNDVSLSRDDVSESHTLEADGGEIVENNDGSKKSELQAKQEFLIICNEVNILSWQSYEENNLPYLMNEKVTEVLLRYISEAPSIDSKAVRALRRMARCRSSVERLLMLQFHTRLVDTLFKQNCNIGTPSSRKGLKRCKRCAERASFCVQTLEEFSSHVDSDFGEYFLRNYLKMVDERQKLKAWIAAVVLIRNPERQRRIFLDYHPLERLIEHLKFIIKSDNFEELWEYSTYKNGSPIVCQILRSLLSLTSETEVKASIESDNSDYYSLMTGNECVLERQRDMPLLKFLTETGEILEEVPKDKLLEGSEYFRGMFENEFSEQSQARDTFIFSEEQELCSADEYRQFLHYLSGCRRQECFDLRNAQNVIVLLQLADRYLCTSLTEMLASQNGPARYFLTGSSLPAYFSVCLLTAAGVNHDLDIACVCCLLGFCTEEEVKETMQSLRTNEIVVDTFTELLHRFVRRSLKEPGRVLRSVHSLSIQL
ncbi:hypothetical protein AB6A40_001524 [Gnathostoma spinigerum]|uniref:Uncharacterized protein n=1 Tax=Gnathostoma spinigerum TaxID=75299 RepID=A0ABD6E5D4_9BILA